jgi:sucrose phosphorylase
MLSVLEQLTERVEHHLAVIYQDVELKKPYTDLCKQLLHTMRIDTADLLVIIIIGIKKMSC